MPELLAVLQDLERVQGFEPELITVLGNEEEIPVAVTLGKHRGKRCGVSVAG